MQLSGKLIRNLALVLGICVVAAGCITTIRRKATCAWCKSVIVSNTYYYDHITKNVSKRIPAGGILGEDVPDVFGHAPTFPRAKQMMKEDLATEVTIKQEGYFFCSLRCVNAYNASRGIKEKRSRVIPHE